MPKKSVRCAIYTRKSTDKGLDRDFNSIDNQRQTCKRFVEGMENATALPISYDDGGYSGGNTDRPALQRLIADIKAGEVDCVVAYKYDRLGRSMIDCLRMFELFADATSQPIVLHCSAGKDRTGVSTAFLLSVLGVDRALIEADYQLTNRDVARQADFIEQTVGLPQGMDRAAMMHAAGVPETAIGDFLDGLHARWGGPLEYLRSIGVSEQTMDAVRREFLE